MNDASAKARTQFPPRSTQRRPLGVQARKRPPIARLLTTLAARTLSYAAPPLAARWLERIFTTPQRFPVPEREQRWMKNAERWTIDFDGRRKLPLYGWGKGPVILLVHGLAGRGSQMGAFVQPLVDAGHRVVTFDALAHGEAEGKQTALPEIALMVQKVGEHLGPLHACIAHSVGTASTTIALSRGMACRRVVYVSPPEDLRGYLLRLAGFVGFTTAVADRTRVRLEKRFDLPFAAARGTNLAPGFDLPALMIHDRQDIMVPIDEGLRLARAWPGAQFVQTEGLGHSRILRDGAIVRLATDFALMPG